MLSTFASNPRDRFLYWLVAQLAALQILILQHCLKEPLWRSADGRVTRFIDMTESHLINTYWMLMKNREPTPALFHVKKEMKRRGLLPASVADAPDCA